MKILVLRFSSIGDIVLTTPVVRALRQQVPGAQVHFATKPAYRGLVANNPHVAKVHCLTGSLNELVAELRAEQFDYIVDLHNNLRTRLIKLQLGVKSSSFDKLNAQKWLLVNLKVNRLPPVHIVERYLAAAAPLGVRDDGHGLDYFIPAQDEVTIATALPAAFQTGYVAFAIGAQHATKRLPTERIIELCRQLQRPIVLLGGPEDAATGNEIVAALQPSGDENSQLPNFTTSPLYNACGKFNLNQSASLVRQAQLVISHDTGLMHIAAAFGKEIISIWGNTVPEFGMYPFRTEFRVWEVRGLDCRPCSKIGYAKCPRGHFRCMRDIQFDLEPPLGTPVANP
ncbi:ADP-heptose:LPS heptosyltransferase [Hymenobacter daecheongensis DSM 21074]|uniref:ADP-heptose:LPS heptosyltransferase n=1 Tax=Hymenobacter daecheongensis DSM 21074 TaxID=1121955 RepID=A0A1M6CN32_9BACT|nr:glycosyltransferase family 9 protein [Hymenobacter daecheongensis]SHI62118.1 ADP-heptose:LPS heptosyltransferase [Hymenobacter daecheongensis DSM 21074]